VVGSFCLLLQRLKRQAACQVQKLPAHRFQSFHQRPSLFDLATSRVVFEFRRHPSGHGGKRRHHPTPLVSSLAKLERVPLAQGILDRPEMVRQACLKRLTNLG